MLCKTEWLWELRTWSHKMNLLDMLSTSPHYFCRKWIGATNENSNFDVRFQRVNPLVLRSCSTMSLIRILPLQGLWNAFWCCYLQILIKSLTPWTFCKTHTWELGWVIKGTRMAWKFRNWVDFWWIMVFTLNTRMGLTLYRANSLWGELDLLRGFSPFSSTSMCDHLS